MTDRNCGYDRKRKRRVSPPDLILIVTEGKKTEPNYFKQFRVYPKEVVEVKGLGVSTVNLVRETEKIVEEKREAIAKKHKIKIKDVSIKVWCVFDRDSSTAGQFNNAINLAHSKGYNVAFSNEAFELWYLLHFHFYDTGISRKQYEEKLSSLLGCEYKKNSNDMYSRLREKQQNAIKNAEKLIEFHKDETSYANKNPCTTVFELVEYLNQFVAGRGNRR